MDDSKPFAGTISHWGYQPITGRIYGLQGELHIQTSKVVLILAAGGKVMCETQNSRYELVAR